MGGLGRVGAIGLHHIDASRLAALMPEGLDRIFFTNSGSESVDSALKIALAVQRAKGQGTRTRLIGRERGYHGTGFGGISVGGLVNNRRAFGGGRSLLFGTLTRRQSEHGGRCGDQGEGGEFHAEAPFLNRRQQAGRSTQASP